MQQAACSGARKKGEELSSIICRGEVVARNTVATKEDGRKEERNELVYPSAVKRSSGSRPPLGIVIGGLRADELEEGEGAK
jgi:hypothetical protein